MTNPVPPEFSSGAQIFFLIEILNQVQNDKTFSYCEHKRGNPAFVY